MTVAALAQARIAFVGKLAGMTKRDAARLVREQGATVIDAGEAADLIVVGEDDLPLRYETGDADLGDLLDPEMREAAEAGRIEVISETQLWQRLGVIEDESHVRRLYTPGMLAGLLGVPVAVVRRWRRRGLIEPVREVRRLAYYDFGEVATARRLAELLAAGMSPQRIEKQLASLRRILPRVERPLAQLSAIVEGKSILLRQGDGLIDAGGQMRFDFDAVDESISDAGPTTIQHASTVSLPLPTETTEPPPATPQELVEMAEALEDEGRLDVAEEAYRAALSAGGPDAEICFELAELLYRQGDLPGARERYYMAVELDDDYVEARANLGCVLAELGQHELAAAAFAGALKYHEEYPDAHFHLARVLCELDRPDEARVHWLAFLELAPESPWAEEARRHLEGV